MLLKTYTLLDANVNFDVKSNISKLMFECEFTMPKQSDLSAASVHQAHVASWILFNSILDHKITITRVDTVNGTTQLISTERLADVVEICAKREGTIQITQKDIMNPNDTNYVAKFSIDLCNNGALKCNATSWLRVELSGMQARNYVTELAWGGASAYAPFTAVNATFRVFSVGSFVESENFIKYSTITVQKDDNVTFDCASNYAVCVDWSMSKLFMDSIAGQNLELVIKELELLSLDASDTLVVFCGISISYFKWGYIPTQLVNSGRIQAAAVSKMFLLSDVNIEK